MGGNLKLIALGLIFLEVLNALRYNKKDAKELLKANKNVLELNFSTANLNEDLLSKTVQNSVKHNITIYDALYAALVQMHKTKLITADKKLIKIPNVIELSDFEN